MGNKLESPSAIVQVTTHVPQVEVDPIDLKLSKLEVVRNKKDKPLILSFNSQENNEISRFLAYYVPLHKYKASALIKDQENVVKKCESIEKLSGKTLSDHIQSFFLFKNKQNKSQVKEELDLLKIEMEEIQHDLKRIEGVLIRLSENDLES